MSTFKLLSAEILHRKTSVALSLCAIVAAATLFVAGPTLMRGYGNESQTRLVAMQEETAEELQKMQDDARTALDDLDKRTKRIMRELGFNLRIVHRNTDMTKLYANFVSLDMPEEYVQRLADSPEITKIVHLVATLRQMIEWEGQQRLLVGFAPEATQSHLEQKDPMGHQVKPGTVFFGHETAKGHKVGDEVEILGKKFKVAHILPAHGRPEEDIAILMDLKDAQEVLNKQGKISEIVALRCKCKTIERLEEITVQLEAVLPEAKVMEHRLNAIARDDQRKLVTAHHQQSMAEYEAGRNKIMETERERHQEMIDLLSAVTSFITPLIVLVCAAWVGLLALANVRERRTEIGLLRAIGKGSMSIATLFLGKAVLLGLAGGLVGCLLGYALARWLALGWLEVTPANFTPQYGVLVATILGAPLISAMASYLPTLSAVTQDPAVVLMEN